MQRYELKLKDLYKKSFFLLKLARTPYFVWILYGRCCAFFCSAIRLDSVTGALKILKNGIWKRTKVCGFLLFKIEGEGNYLAA